MFQNLLVAHGLLKVHGRYLLLHRASGRHYGNRWDIPGGTVEPGEQPHEAARRECFEETGLDCRIGGVVTHFSNKDTNGRDIYFHTLTFSMTVQGSTDITICSEHQGYEWVTLPEALTLPLVWHVAKTLETQH